MCGNCFYGMLFICLPYFSTITHCKAFPIILRMVEPYQYSTDGSTTANRTAAQTKHQPVATDSRTNGKFNTAQCHMEHRIHRTLDIDPPCRWSANLVAFLHHNSTREHEGQERHQYISATTQPVGATGTRNMERYPHQVMHHRQPTGHTAVSLQPYW